MLDILNPIEKHRVLISCICVYVLALLSIIRTQEDYGVDCLIENLIRLEDQITDKLIFEEESNNSMKYAQEMIIELSEYNKNLLRVVNHLYINKSKSLVEYIYRLDRTFGPKFLDLSLDEIPIQRKLCLHDKNVHRAITYTLNTTQYLWDECVRVVAVTDSPIRNIIVTNDGPFRWE